MLCEGYIDRCSFWCKMYICVTVLPECCQIVCVSHGWLQTSGEGHVHVKAHAWTSAHLDTNTIQLNVRFSKPSNSQKSSYWSR